MKQLSVIAAVGLLGVAACGSDEKQTPGTQTTVAATTIAAPTTTGTQATGAATTLVARPTTSGAQTVSYASCAEAKAAGAAPLHRGDPGYSSNLDRDGDGVACET